jgi:hypothetical protein
MPNVDHCQPRGRSSPPSPRRTPAPPHSRRNPRLEPRPQPPDLVWIVSPRTERTHHWIRRRGSGTRTRVLPNRLSRPRSDSPTRISAPNQPWSPVPPADPLTARPRVLRQRPTPALALRHAYARRAYPHPLRAEVRMDTRPPDDPSGAAAAYAPPARSPGCAALSLSRGSGPDLQQPRRGSLVAERRKAMRAWLGMAVAQTMCACTHLLACEPHSSD